MRAYPSDSAQAAARIVALTMLCDGHLSKSEVDAFEHHGATQRLGLGAGQWQQVMSELCEDLLAGAPLCWHASCSVDPDTLSALLAEIRDPKLRAEVLDVCRAVADADGHSADGEVLVVRSAAEQWGLAPSLKRPAAAAWSAAA